MISTTLFWSSAAMLVYTYVGFGLILALYGTLRRRRVRKAPYTPNVSLIIAAYNEEHSIAEKLDNALRMDYPRDQLEIIVASDGSDDRTNVIVSGYASRGVKLLALPRKGKIAALDSAIQEAQGELLLFSDANTLLDAQALRKIAANFADPQVGGVCGNQVYTGGEGRDSTAKGEQAYWRYDKWLKTCETNTGSIVSADGSVYAIRRQLYRRPASSAVTDDFAISTAVVAQGYRLVFEPEAYAFEKPAMSAEKEFGRKVRIINRGLRGVMLRRKLLNPFRYGFYSLILLSHKLLRRLVPFFLLVMLLSSVWLISYDDFYFAAALAQIAFYALAATSYTIRNTSLGQWKIFYIPFFYCLANIAALVAVLRLLAGRRIELWQPQR